MSLAAKQVHIVKGDDHIVAVERELVYDARTGIAAEVEKTTVAVDLGGGQIGIARQQKVTGVRVGAARAPTQAPAIRSQTQPVVARPYQYHSDIGQTALVFAIATSIFLFFFQCYWGLICSVVGIVLASNATSAATRGDIQRAKAISSTSMGCTCTVGGIVFGVVGVVALIVGFIAWYVSLVAD